MATYSEPLDIQAISCLSVLFSGRKTLVGSNYVRVELRTVSSAYRMILTYKTRTNHLIRLKKKQTVKEAFLEFKNTIANSESKKILRRNAIKKKFKSC